MTQELRMTLTAGMAVVLTSMVLFPLFQSAQWFFAGIGAVITVGGAGLLSRRRTLPPLVCFLITVVALVLYLNLVFAARHSWAAVIPTPGSMSALWRTMQDGFSESRRFSSPAPGLAGLTLLAATGVGITAVMTDLIAVRLRSVALAGLPLLVLFTVPSTFNASRSALATGVIFFLGTIGFLAMLSADGRERIRIWGRLVSLWRTGEGQARDRSRYQVLRGPDTRALAAAGRRVGFASILLALCAPLLIPGLHPTRLGTTTWTIGSGTGNGSLILPNALNLTTSQLDETHPTTIFTYTSTQDSSLRANAQYLQMYVMTPSGDGWVLGSGSGLNLTTLNTQMQPQGPGITNAGSLAADTTITIPSGAAPPPSNLAVALPAPFPAYRAAISTSGWQVDKDTDMLLSKAGITAGLTYTIGSRYVNPGQAGLASVAPPPAGIVAQYTTVPSAYEQYAPLRKELDKIIGGEKTDFGKAEALEAWFAKTGGFIYSLGAQQFNTPVGLMDFLTKHKQGYCLNFAEAFTIMMRMAGVPTRLVLGYTQGIEDPNHPGHWTVTSADAHAWPQVFFPGWGWVRFEPTTGGANGTASSPSFDQSAQTAQTSPGTGPDISPGSTPATSTGGSGKPGKTNPDFRLRPPGDSPVGATPNAVVKPAGTPWTAIALAVLAAIALVCGVIALVGPASRRLLATRPGQPTGDRVRLNAGVVVVAALAGAGIIALALYRTLSRTHGVNLGAGWAAVGIAFGATCAAALAVPTVLRLALRRWRWIRAGSDEAKAHAAWVELCADLADYGIGYLPSESPRAVAGRLRSGLALAEPAALAVSRIALAEEHASYAGRAPEAAQTLHRDGVAARRGIARATTTPARWRARVLPTSVLTTIAETAARLPATWNRLTSRLTHRDP